MQTVTQSGPQPETQSASIERCLMTALESKAWHSRPSFRFLIAGGANTALTGAIVVLLSIVVAPSVAFTAAFALGLAYATVVNGRWVFRSRLSPARVLAFTLSYCAIYAVGLATVQLLVALDGPPVTRGASVLVTAPLSFFVGRRIFTDQGKAAGSTT